MALLDLFKPAPYQPEIQDEEVTKQQYKYWRWRIFYGMYVGYVFYYFSRKSLASAMPALMQDLGMTKIDLGILGSIFAITYGLSKFVSGLLADRSNPRYFMAIGLILTGLINIFFGNSSSILVFALFWGINGWFQGWGWPPCARLLTHWYSQKERGTWWGAWSTSHGVGGGLIMMIAAYFAQYWGWRYALWIPGASCIVVGLFLINRLRDTPQSLGLPPIEKFKNDYPGTVHAEEKELSMKEILFEYVLRNKYIWVLALSYFFVYIVRSAVNDWSQLFLVETKGYSMVVAAVCVLWFEIGGIVGSVAAGWGSDKIFGGRRAPINVLFSLGVIFAVAAFYYSPQKAVLLDATLLFAVGFLIFGPQVLIGMAAAELSHKKAAGTATGLISWVAYLGAATAGYPLGKVAQEWGWHGYYILLGACGAISALLLIPLWNIKANPKYERAEAPVPAVAPPSES